MALRSGPELFDELIAQFDQRPLKVACGEFIFTMNEAEEFAEQIENLLRPV